MITAKKTSGSILPYSVQKFLGMVFIVAFFVTVFSILGLIWATGEPHIFFRKSLLTSLFIKAVLLFIATVASEKQ